MLSKPVVKGFLSTDMLTYFSLTKKRTK